MKTIIITGPTASGKSDLALQLAMQYNGIILSVDSLSIYKEIDIASAKPSKKELQQVLHFGIDELNPNEKFDVVKFLSIYKKAKAYAIKKQKNLFIVGGTSFYIKVLTQGISQMPQISCKTQERVQELLQNLPNAYNYLKNIDPLWAKKIASNDSYRIQKALELFFETKKTPSSYFAKNPPKAIEPNVPIFEIDLPKEQLKQKIIARTKKMLQAGLIDEVCNLERKYTRAIQPTKAIGIKETLSFLDGYITKKELLEEIIKNTAALAKRQRTFNKTQLQITKKAPSTELKKNLRAFFN